jgi:predicted small lipoprotein YifL
MSHFNPPRLPAIPLAVATVVLASLLSACGQKGPLYLPSKPDAISTPAKPATTPTTNTLPATPVSQ